MFSSKKIALAFALILSALTAVAQDKGIFLSYSAKTATGLNGSPKFQAVNFTFAPGYDFGNRWYVQLNVEAAVDLFKGGGLKTYRSNALLGAAAGFDMLHTPDDRLGIVVGAGNSLRTKVWNYTYLDAGVRWSAGKSVCWPVLETGLRYCAAHDDKFDSYWCWYLSIGFRLF